MPSQPASLAMSSKPSPLSDAPGQQLPLVRVPQAAAPPPPCPRPETPAAGCAAAGWTRRCRDTRRRTGPAPPACARSSRASTWGILRVPVVPAHGLQVADVHRDLQGPGHRPPSPPAASTTPPPSWRMCTVMGMLCPASGARARISSVGGIEALRRVAQAQGHAQGPVGQSPLQPPVNGRHSAPPPGAAPA